MKATNFLFIHICLCVALLFFVACGNSDDKSGSGSGQGDDSSSDDDDNDAGNPDDEADDDLDDDGTDDDSVDDDNDDDLDDDVDDDSDDDSDDDTSVDCDSVANDCWFEFYDEYTTCTEGCSKSSLEYSMCDIQSCIWGCSASFIASQEVCLEEANCTESIPSMECSRNCDLTGIQCLEPLEDCTSDLYLDCLEASGTCIANCA